MRMARRPDRGSPLSPSSRQLSIERLVGRDENGAPIRTNITRISGSKKELGSKISSPIRRRIPAIAMTYAAIEREPQAMRTDHERTADLE